MNFAGSLIFAVYAVKCRGSPAETSEEPWCGQYLPLYFKICLSYIFCDKSRFYFRLDIAIVFILFY